MNFSTLTCIASVSMSKVQHYCAAPDLIGRIIVMSYSLFCAYVVFTEKPDVVHSDRLTSGSGRSGVSRQVSRDTARDAREPYSDESSLDEFVSAVERFMKQLDSLTKPSLKGPTPLDKLWEVSVVHVYQTCLLRFLS